MAVRHERRDPRHRYAARADDLVAHAGVPSRIVELAPRVARQPCGLVDHERRLEHDVFQRRRVRVFLVDWSAAREATAGGGMDRHVLILDQHEAIIGLLEKNQRMARLPERNHRRMFRDAEFDLRSRWHAVDPFGHAVSRLVPTVEDPAVVAAVHRVVLVGQLLADEHDQFAGFAGVARTGHHHREPIGRKACCGARHERECQYNVDGPVHRHPLRRD